MDFLNNIIKFSLHNKLLVLLGSVLVAVGGVFCAGSMDIDVFPDLTAPTVVVMTDAGGMAAEEVEKLVTFPIETAMNGATKVRRVRSSSKFGNSFVWVEFDWGMDVLKARQIVSEKLVTISEELPSNVVPVLAPQSSVMGEILFVGLRSTGQTSQMDLRTLTDWTVKPAILATGGVSQVTVIGGDYKQYQILADPQKMAAFNVSYEELEAAAASLSVNSEGGVIRDFGNEYALRGIGRSTDLEELGMSLVKMEGGYPVVISDVATVRVGAAVKMGHASMDGQKAVLLSISKQPNINTLEVTSAIEKNLKAIAETLPEDVVMDTRVLRQADYIESSVHNVARALLEGAIFVVLILFLFLGSFRTTLISVIAIPVSLLATVIVLKLFGMDINTMTLGGMCIAIGSLVDDAIIDVENVYKRLRQNHAKDPSEREGVLKVVFEGSKEIRTSMINATLIVMVAFTPLFFLSGMEGRLLKPLGITYIIALFMSLIVAMTLTPLLCSLMLTDDRYLRKNEKDKKFTAALGRAYSNSLQWVLAHKKIALSVLAGLFVLAGISFLTMGSAFLPKFLESSATITAVTAPGTSLEVSDELGNLMEKKLHEVPEVTKTARRTGRGELDEHSQTSNSCEIEVGLKLGKRKLETVLDDMRAKLATIPGIASTVGQPLGHRIDHMVSGTKAAIAIKIFGDDLSKLLMLGNSVKASIEGIEGLVDVAVEQITESPQLQVRADRGMLARYGITMEEFNRFITLAFAGEKVSDIYEGQQRFDVVMRLNSDYTESVEGVRNALIDTPDGKKVPLGEVAEIVSTMGPNAISRENVQRKLVVSANTSGRDVVSIVEDIKDAIAKDIMLPEGYRIEYGGQFESARNANRTLALATVLALLVIFILLYGEFRNMPLTILVLCSLPFALIGGIFAVRISSGVISIPSTIGFITLLGIAVRNGVLLISRYMHLCESGLPVRESILAGSADRLNPILMTALTSALALIPLVLSGGKSGNEIQSPMGIVVLGGLITSTIINIYILPVLFEWIYTRKAGKQAKEVKK